MDIQPLDIVIHIINIAVLYVLLRILLYNPVMRYLHARTEAIQESLRKAKAAEDEAGELKEAVEQRLHGADDEAQKRLLEGTQKASEEAAQIVEQANQQAQHILIAAREKADDERKQIVRSLEQQISDMAIHLASEVLKREVSAEDNKKVIDDFFDKAV